MKSDAEEKLLKLHRLFAPVFYGRWNREGQLVVCTAFNSSPASLENMVPQMGQGILDTSFYHDGAELSAWLPLHQQAGIDSFAHYDYPAGLSVADHCFPAYFKRLERRTLFGARPSLEVLEETPWTRLNFGTADSSGVSKTIFFYTRDFL